MNNKTFLKKKYSMSKNYLKVALEGYSLGKAEKVNENKLLKSLIMENEKLKEEVKDWRKCLENPGAWI